MHQVEGVLLPVTHSWKSHSITSSTFYFPSQFQNFHIQGKGKRLMGTSNQIQQEGMIPEILQGLFFETQFIIILVVFWQIHQYYLDKHSCYLQVEIFFIKKIYVFNFFLLSYFNDQDLQSNYEQSKGKHLFLVSTMGQCFNISH